MQQDQVYEDEDCDPQENYDENDQGIQVRTNLKENYFNYKMFKKPYNYFCHRITIPFI